MNFLNILNYVEPYSALLELLVVIILTAVAFSIALKLIKRALLKKVQRKKQISNVIIFIDLLKFIFILFLLIIVVSFYYGDWGELGFIAGLLTIALGWSLQKPISGVVAWLVIVTRRPFYIRDRVIISGIKGDISNITLTHIFLKEVGGTIEGEELSGRTIMIPTSLIFEQEIINYTHRDNYILDEVTTAITYESDLNQAETVIVDAVNLVMQPLWEKFPKRIKKEPHIHLQFKESGIDVTVRYMSLASKRNQISTEITREIFKIIRTTDDVEIAYPHTEVILRNQNK